MKFFQFAIFVIFNSLCFLCFGQRDFRPGYVIVVQGDTLFGQIDYRSDTRMGMSCDFKTETGEIRNFSPYNIYGFRFNDGKYFISRNINESKKVFLEYLIKGKLDVYYLRDETGDRYFIEKEDKPLIEMPYKEEFIMKDGKEYRSHSVKHWTILNYYTQEAPELESKITTIKKPNHKNLINFAESYHNVMCDDEKCIIYEKKLPTLKVNFEIVGGIIEHKLFDKNKTYLEWGVFSNFWLPYSNENLFFKTGLLWSEISIIRKDNSEVREKSYKIPLRLEYIYPNSKIIRPRFNLGLNILFPAEYIGYYDEIIKEGIMTTYSLSAGINIKVLKNLQIVTLYDTVFVSYETVLPNNLFSHSFLTGLYFVF
ncbi:MAG: hypothetical protein FWH18_06700 [Marinilabiliaceae bacterium]|nr:hypothetical protein [Marinilabiliaceae bacterium]